MMDWNGDGRVNSMDTYDMMHDTSNGTSSGSRKRSGSNVLLTFLKQILVIGVICLIISLIEPTLAKVLLVGFLLCRIAFP